MIATLIVVAVLLLAFGVGLGLELNRNDGKKDVGAFIVVWFFALLVAVAVHPSGWQLAQEHCGCDKCAHREASTP